MRKERAGTQVRQACEVLQHYHIDHTDDAITRFSHSSGNGVDIYLVSDPFWKAEVKKLFDRSVLGDRPETPEAKPGGGVAKT